MGRTKGSGAGSVYKRGDKWRGQITVDGVRLSHTAAKKKEVLDWLAEVRMNNPEEEHDYTVKEWFEIYFEKYLRQRVKEATYIGNYRLLSKHLYPVLGDEKLSDVTSDMIQEAMPKMFTGKEYSPGTYRIFHTRLRDGFNYAVKKNILKINPTLEIVPPKAGPIKKVEAFTMEEQKKIVDYCRDKNGPDRVYYFLIATGMRVGEAICLTWDDVNLKEGYIDINKTAVKTKGYTFVQDHPKTGQSIRRIYVSENTKKFLEGLADEKMKNSNLVLPNRCGNIYNVSTLRSHWMKTCEILEIPYKSMHALRHSWATRALDGKIDIRTVSRMLGHKSIATTINIYQSIFDENKKEAAKIMNQFV